MYGRNIIYWILGSLLYITLHFLCWKLGYREGIDLQYFPAYQEASRGGWLCLASMDSLRLADVSKPYSGWPILYGFLLAFPSKAGIPFEAGVMLVNAVIGLATAALLYRLLKIIGAKPQGMIVILAACLTGAYWSSITTAFAHRLIPFGMFAGVLSWARWSNSVKITGRASASLWAISFLWGIVVGSTNWSCYFIVPAVAFIALGTYIGQRDSISFRNAISWCFAFGSGTVCAFLAFKLFHNAALHESGALAAPLSGTSSRIFDRMTPSPRDVVATGFYGIIRVTWALLPLLPLILFQKFKLNRSNAQFDIRYQTLAILTLAVLFFILTLSGEMAMAAHRFYVILFLAPAAYAFNLLFSACTGPRQLTALFLSLASTAFSLFGYLVLPWNLLTTPRQSDWPAGYINPVHSSPFLLSGESYNASSILRTALRQWCLPPVRDLKPNQNISARQRDWFRDASTAIQSSCPPDGLLIGCAAELSLETYECERPLVFVSTLAELEAYLSRLKPLVEQNRVILAIQNDLPPEMADLLSRINLEAHPISHYQSVSFCKLSIAEKP